MLNEDYQIEEIKNKWKNEFKQERLITLPIKSFLKLFLQARSGASSLIIAGYSLNNEFGNELLSVAREIEFELETIIEEISK